MLIEDMSNEQLREEIEKLKPLLMQTEYDRLRFKAGVSMEAIEHSHKLQGWRWSLINAYSFKLLDELARRSISKRKWKKWWREFRKRD